MATVQSLPELLGSLTSSLNTLATNLPSIKSIQPPADGISLLDTKNELLLSYLQNLVFLILLKLRNASNKNTEDSEQTADEVVKKLVELRVYLDRGVRPLESKIRYQIDEAVRAADSHEAHLQHKTTNVSNKSSSKKNQKAITTSDLPTGDSSESDNASEASDSSSEEISRPAFANMANPSRSQTDSKTSNNGVYRPPRIAAVLPPSTTPAQKSSRPQKSRVLDDYITSELNAAPTAEPSIGANILDRGRGDIQSARERKIASERQRYEEENLTRLPGMGKKEKRRFEGERAKRGQFGGEEWSGLGGNADRIVELTGRGKGGGKGALERSRKRGLDDDGATGGGGRIGGDFERKRRMLEKRANRKR